MTDSTGAQAHIAPAGNAKPPANFPKQAIVVIHGMGEQKPMDTIKDFVRAVWSTDPEITENSLPFPAETWSKPDLRTGSLELRRITTRQSIPSPSFARGVRSDFYELYWADLLGGSTWHHVRDWIAGLLFRNPLTRVPRRVLLAWILLWLAAIIILIFAIATVLPHDASFMGYRLWNLPVLRWLEPLQTWQLALVTLLASLFVQKFLVPYFGDVVRYTRANPENITARKNARERGLALLNELHKAEYERIVLVGHSLGAILAYDLLSYFWATRPRVHTVDKNNAAEFSALRALEKAARRVDEVGDEASIAAYFEKQNEFCRLLRRRADRDARWLITDFVTLGSPLVHAEFLLAHSSSDLDQRKVGREFPTSPPEREPLDPEVLARARHAGFSLSESDPRLFCFSVADKWQLHHAAPFAAVRWTNIHDPARFVFLGDIISGPIAPVLGPAIHDIDLRALRGQSLKFTHTDYWTILDETSAPPQVRALRTSLDLAGIDRVL